MSEWGEWNDTRSPEIGCLFPAECCMPGMHYTDECHKSDYYEDETDNQGEAMIEGFSVYRRNHGHWDVSSKEKGRLFRVRGEPGAYVVIDERKLSIPVIKFKTVTSCMTYICEILMHEELQLDGVSPIVVDGCGNPVKPKENAEP